MNVLLISLQRHGGGAHDTLGISNGLCENHFSHTLVIAEGNERAAEFTANEWRRVVKLPTYTGMGDFFMRSLALSRPLRLWHAIAEAKPDVVHVTHFHPWALVAFLVQPLYKYRIAYGAHEDPYARKDTTNPWIMTVLERSFIMAADTVVTYSDYMKGVLAARGVPEKKIYASRLGAYEYFCANFKRHDDTAAVAHAPLKLLFFGPVKQYKGVDTLVAAITIVKKNKVNAVLTIAGKQAPGVHIIDRVETDALGVTWHDRYVSDEEMCRLFGESDVMMIPYKEATQTTPGAFALAYGMPAIATRAGGLPEQVVDGVSGILVAPGDADGMAKAIARIAEDKDLIKKFREGAQKLYREKFAWKVVMKDVITHVYER